MITGDVNVHRVHTSLATVNLSTRLVHASFAKGRVGWTTTVDITVPGPHQVVLFRKAGFFI